MATLPKWLGAPISKFINNYLYYFGEIYYSLLGEKNTDSRIGELDILVLLCLKKDWWIYNI